MPGSIVAVASQQSEGGFTEAVMKCGRGGHFACASPRPAIGHEWPPLRMTPVKAHVTGLFSALQQCQDLGGV